MGSPAFLVGVLRLRAKLPWLLFATLPLAPEVVADGGPCKDSVRLCQDWALHGECAKNAGYMELSCCESCRKVVAHCYDREKECSHWAAQGECRRNADFMVPACPMSCRVCHLQFRPDCRRGAEAKAAAKKGTVDEVLSAVVGEQLRYHPKVLSRDPWLVQLEDFLEPWEADSLVKHAGQGLTRSLAGDELTEVRTSSQVFCMTEECLSDGVVQAVWTRIAKLLRVPRENAEHLQLLRYELGQAYDTHHDQNSHRLAAWGPRLYTFFMYLSDVEEGGETVFPKQNITVTPRKGRALLWPSVLSRDPFAMDSRTLHKAMPVRKGVKYAANLWLHMYDFQNPLLRGCQQTQYFQDYIMDEIWPREPEGEL